MKLYRTQRATLLERDGEVLESTMLVLDRGADELVVAMKRL